MGNLSPVKAVRAYCLECSANQPSEVRNCPMVDCPLYSFRMGKNPNRKGIGNLKGSHCSDPRTLDRDSAPELSN